MRSLVKTLLPAAALLAASPAVADTYPFEGAWEQNGNGCGQADTFGARRFTTYGDRGVCAVVGLNTLGESTFTYAVRCRGDAGSYNSSGTIRMLGPDRMRVTDKTMDGQSTLYTRCR